MSMEDDGRAAWARRTRDMAEGAAVDYLDGDVTLIIGSIAASSADLGARRLLARELASSGLEAVRSGLADLALQMAADGDPFAEEVSELLGHDPDEAIRFEAVAIRQLAATAATA